VGLGVDHDALVSYASSLSVGAGAGAPNVGAYGRGTADLRCGP